jgi:hypothetical protein
MISKILILTLIIIEVGLFIIMALITGSNYKNYPILFKILWRIVLLVPIGLIIIPSLIIEPQTYKVLLFVGFCIVLAADMAIIFSSLAGLFVFLVYHIINIINYRMLSEKARTTRYQWYLLLILLLFWLVIMLVTFKSQQIKKFLINANVPVIFQQPIYAKLLIFIYIASVLISCWCGYNLITNKNIIILFPIFASIGALIFAAGDYFIIYEIIKRPDNPFHQILNNTLYYVPLIFYALLSVLK